MKTIIFIALLLMLTGCEAIVPIAHKILMSIAADAVVEVVKDTTSTENTENTETTEQQE